MEKGKALFPESCVYVQLSTFMCLLPDYIYWDVIFF